MTWERAAVQIAFVARAAMVESHTVCRVAELAEGKGKTICVGKRLIAVFCHAGAYHAIDDVCPHMGASLSEGEVEAGIVTCPWHGWRFRLSDGTWADNPRVKIGSYPVSVVDDMIRVQVGPPPAAGASVA